jgi:UDP-2-acetamido-4-(D-alanylamino)-2,4,6-trideoxy-alpha-D-mannopyranose hydrolase
MNFLQTKPDFVLYHDATLRNAMELFEKNGKKIVLIIDNSKKFLGLISEGDVRRHLLTSPNIEEHVTAAMNRNPITLPSGCSKNSIIEIFEHNDVACIPIIDENGSLVDLAIRGQDFTLPKHPNYVIIMAGGFGTRLGNMTKTCPKPMLKIEGKPMIEHIIQKLKRSGFSNFIITTHYLNEIINEYFGDGVKWNVNISYIHEDSPLGTGGALTLLPDDITDLPIIITNGDVITDLDYSKFLEFHNKKQFDITMCVKRLENKIDFGVVEVNQDIVEKIVEKPTMSYLINSGVYVVNFDQLSKFERGIEITMPEIIEHCQSYGSIVGSFVLKDYWIDVGQPKDFYKVRVNTNDKNN